MRASLLILPLSSPHLDDPAGDVGLVPELDGGDLPHAEPGHARQRVVQQVFLVAGAGHPVCGRDKRS